MTDQPFRYLDYDFDTLRIAAAPDVSGYEGTRPVVALEIENRDEETLTIYVELADVENVIDAIRSAAQDAGHAAGVDCRVPDCGPCSFNRAIPHPA